MSLPNRLMYHRPSTSSHTALGQRFFTRIVQHLYNKRRQEKKNYINWLKIKKVGWKLTFIQRKPSFTHHDICQWPGPVWKKFGTFINNTTRNRNFHDSISTIGLTHFQTSTEPRLPGCYHLPVSCLFTLAFLIRYHPPNPRPHYRGDWKSLNLLVRDFTWHSHPDCKIPTTNYTINCTSELISLRRSTI